MRKRFLKTAAAMMAITLVVSTCSVTALAEGESENEVTENLTNNNTERTVNEENFNENNAYIETNYGNIKTNNDTIKNNNGFVRENKGTVEDNNKYIHRNAASEKSEESEETSSKGTVTNNDGGIDINDGDIDINNGHVENNNGGATINNNQGTGEVGVNYGRIINNSAKKEGTSEQSNANGGGVHYNYHDIINNTGFVENNQGYIGDNSGTVMYNGVDNTSNNGVNNTSESDIESMATIINNTGTVKQNGDYYKETDAFDEKATVINKDGGVVVTNNGIVENYTGGTVTINNGAVYNYGGKVTGSTSDDSTEHGKGTEYFSVSINTENGSEVYGKEFKDYKDNKWLGQTYDFENKDWTTSSSEVTITPTSGYEIASLNIPDKYSEYVSATKNSDGTWTLSVKSGYNISLTPTATLIATSTLDNSGNSGIPGTSAVSVEVSVSSDSDSDSNDSGNKPAQNSNNDFQVSPPGSMMNQMMISSVDFIGQGLSAPLSEVLQKIDNITAINNFQAMGITIPSTENVMACGVVDFKNAFVNAATGNVDVPVEATVIAGNTYTVALSDGTIIEVQCTTNGILNIPFTANAQNLTFIIYGTQSNDFRLAN